MYCLYFVTQLTTLTLVWTVSFDVGCLWWGRVFVVVDYPGHRYPGHLQW